MFMRGCSWFHPVSSILFLTPPYSYELVHKGYDDWLQAKLGALRGDAAPSASADAAPAAPGPATAP